MAEVINGFELSKKLRGEMKERVASIKSDYGRVPKLSVILVGDNPASISYVTGKEKACKEIGIDSEIIRLSEDILEEELLKKIDDLNNDCGVDGILVQLPLPKHIREDEVIKQIAISKDVDGFHPMNVAKLHLKEECMLPCTPKGIITMLKSKNIEIKGKNCVVIGRSNLVGKPVAELLMHEDGTVTICHSKTQNIIEYTKKADILVVAIGKPKVIDGSMIKEGATVIDVGVNKVDGHLCGDVDFESCLDKAAYITPVPRGVGPMTITSLLENTIIAFLSRMR